VLGVLDELFGRVDGGVLAGEEAADVLAGLAHSVPELFEVDQKPNTNFVVRVVLRRQKSSEHVPPPYLLQDRRLVQQAETVKSRRQDERRRHVRSESMTTNVVLALLPALDEAPNVLEVLLRVVHPPSSEHKFLRLVAAAVEEPSGVKRLRRRAD